MATAADEEDYDRAMEQAAYQSGALTDAIKALGHLRLRTRKPPDSMLPTMKPLDSDKKVEKVASTPAEAAQAAPEAQEKIDFSNVEIEPLFQD